VKIRTPEQYLARYKKRGRKKVISRSELWFNANNDLIQTCNPFASNKPQHQERVVDIETCFPLFVHDGRKLKRFYA
jgi:hypothetical protein